MPEGDTIHYAANRIRPVLEGRVPDEIEAPHPRFALDRWEQRLAGRAVESVDAHGKHLFIRFEGDLVLHSHLRMTGSWKVVQADRRRPRAGRRLWFRATVDGIDILQFGGPVLELMTESRTRFDQRLAELGPDLIKDDFDAGVFLRRLRQDDPTRSIGDALLDQRTVAGIGNIWKSESCFDAAIDPWRPTAAIADGEALAIVSAARLRMRRSAVEGFASRELRAYRREGKPCPRCGVPIQHRRQGEDNRSTYWCAACQR